MTTFTYKATGKLTRAELAKRLRVRADQLESLNDAYTGELPVDAKGNAKGGVANSYWTIRGLKV